jgi:hypothetical protein
MSPRRVSTAFRAVRSGKSKCRGRSDPSRNAEVALAIDRRFDSVDTKVLVRLLVRDELDQVNAAESFIAPGAWVSHLVLAEALWVLDAVYDRTAEQIAVAVDRLLNHEELTIQVVGRLARGIRPKL